METENTKLGMIFCVGSFWVLTAIFLYAQGQAILWLVHHGIWPFN